MHLCISIANSIHLFPKIVLILMAWYDYGRVTIEHDLEGLVFVTVSLLSHFNHWGNLSPISYPPSPLKLRTVSSFHPSGPTLRWAFSSHCGIPVTDSYPFLRVALPLPILLYTPTSFICLKHAISCILFL